MTTGRLMTTLSVLALGFAVAGAVPALAQNTTMPPAAANEPSTGATSPTLGANATPPAPTEQQGAAQSKHPTTRVYCGSDGGANTKSRCD
jgi:hypothetical protein